MICILNHGSNVCDCSYECVGCKQLFTVTADLEQRNVIQVPALCPAGMSVAAESSGSGRGRGRPAGMSRTCKSTTFNVVEGATICRDYQEIKVRGRCGRAVVVSYLLTRFRVSGPGEDSKARDGFDTEIHCCHFAG